MAVTVQSQPTQAARVRLPDLEKYEVLEEIGHGGMATVYRAKDRRLGREVAVKVIHPHLRESTEVAHRFRGEAQAVAKLRHPNIVDVYDVSGDEEREQYLVVELVRGRTLRKILKEKGELPPEIAAALGIELLGALAHAHGEGVVHRDVKPENVIVEHTPPNPDGQSEGARVRVKLTDFGIAKLLDAQGVTSTGQVLGSPAHMAPEQIEGGEVDARADVFGLGVLLYECMVGHLPFEGANPAQVLRRVLDGTYASAERERPKIGRSWSGLLDRALAREPSARFRDANEMKSALVAELDRLGMDPPKELLAEYFDDPAAFAAKHEKRLVERLAKLGTEARRDGRHMEAAAHTNRALAYAPNDPALLAAASSLGKREAGMRFLRRGVPLILGTVLFGALGFWGSRALVRRPRVDPPPSPTTGPVTATPRASAAALAPSADPTASTSVAAPLPAPPVVKPVGHPAASASTIKPAERALKISAISPRNGVLVSLDGKDAVSADAPIPISRERHTVELSCLNDFCEHQTHIIEASADDVPLAVSLTIKPAILVVEAEGAVQFQLRAGTNKVFGPREQVSVPMTTGILTTYVFDVSAPDRGEKVELKAGKETRITFSPAETR